MYHHALVAVDDSAESFAAVQHAVEMLKEDTIEQITLITVVREPLHAKEHPWPNEWVGPGGFFDTQEIDPENKRFALNRLETIKHYLEETEIKAEVLIRLGDPAEAISQAANEGPYDLVIMGGRGFNRLEGTFMNSVSQRVMANVSCPVLIINSYAAGLKDIEEAQDTPAYYEI